MQFDISTFEKIVDEFIFRNMDWYTTSELDLSYDDKLAIILSESLQALSFVTTIEDEFNIEFDDEGIDTRHLEIDRLARAIRGLFESHSRRA